MTVNRIYPSRLRENRYTETKTKTSKSPHCVPPASIYKTEWAHKLLQKITNVQIDWNN